MDLPTFPFHLVMLEFWAPELYTNTWQLSQQALCSAEIAQYYLLLTGFKMQSPVTQTKMELLHSSS